MKDLFSVDASLYAKARPTYPDALISYLLSITKSFHTLWDVGTGNGQLAALLAPYFDQVIATDISKEQLTNAIQKSNIKYLVQPAESSSFKDQSVDLITIAQAVHWFDLDKFYNEVKRVLSPNGVIAVVGYPLIKVNEEIDKVIDYLHDDILGSYWDPECSYLDEHYLTLPFPFKEIPLPSLSSHLEWDFEHLVTFLKTWSGVRHFINKNSINPLEEIIPMLKNTWGDAQTRTVSFPVIGRIGQL